LAEICLIDKKVGNVRNTAVGPVLPMGEVTSVILFRSRLRCYHFCYPTAEYWQVLGSNRRQETFLRANRINRLRIRAHQKVPAQASCKTVYTISILVAVHEGAQSIIT
jgi:hypothetical protein